MVDYAKRYNRFSYNLSQIACGQATILNRREAGYRTNGRKHKI